MTRDDGSTTVPLPAAEAVLVCEVRRLLGMLAALRVAVNGGEAETDLDDIDVPLRAVLDDAGDMLSIGVLERDGKVTALCGYHLSAARQIMQQATTTDAGTPPASWH